MSPGGALQRLLEAVTEARKLEVENGHQWKQTKNLLKYIKNQERESVKTERSEVIIIIITLEPSSILNYGSL